MKQAAIIFLTLMALAKTANAFEWTFYEYIDEIDDSKQHIAYVEAKGDWLGNPSLKVVCFPSGNLGMNVNPGAGGALEAHDAFTMVDNNSTDIIMQATMKYRIDKESAKSITVINNALSSSAYYSRPHDSSQFASDLLLGSKVLVKIGRWSSKFTLKGSNAAISKVLAKCP